nr:hypothetical protein GCM10020093_010710 [Planobispora longispora]
MGVIDGLPAELREWLDEFDQATLTMFRRLDTTLHPGTPTVSSTTRA